MKQEISRRQWLICLAASGIGAASVRQLRAAESGTASRQLQNVTKRRTHIVAFDVIETLFDTKPLDPLLSSIGLPEGSLQVWFARFLRDAFALEVIGEYRPFHEVAAASLEASCSNIDSKLDAKKSTRCSQVLQSCRLTRT